MSMKVFICALAFMRSDAQNNTGMPSINGIIYKKYAVYSRHIFINMLLLLENLIYCLSMQLLPARRCPVRTLMIFLLMNGTIRSV